MAYYDSFRAARWIRFCNLILQAILFLTLFAGLNYVAQNHSWRFDLTQDHRHSLSPETEAYLQSLKRDVRIIVTLSSDGGGAGEEGRMAFRDITGLLREYAYFTRNQDHARIEVRQLDIYQNRREAEALGIDKPNQVVLISENNRRALEILDFYENKEAKRAGFKGESVVTAAILSVSVPDKKKIYFLTGHGELRPDDVDRSRGMSRLRDQLVQRNFDVAILDLSLTRKVPDDAALVVVVLPIGSGRIQPFEEELLRNYLTTRAGRLFVLVSPGVAHGMENLLFDWGVLVHDNVIYDLNPESVTENNDMRLHRFMPDKDSHITDTLLNNVMKVIVGATRVVSDELRSMDDGLRAKKLIATSADAWGEASYRIRNVLPSYTPGQDMKSPQGLGVMVISERLKPANLPLSVRGGRVAVIGTSELATNDRIINIGNLTLFLSTVGWAVDRDVQLNTKVRPIERFQLTMSADELRHLNLALLLGVPGCVAVLGIIVYWTRRN